MASCEQPSHHLTPAEGYLPKYRRDIDGLRALAILSVVLYHASPTNFPGGFIGVDVFFVISGFLISTIILEDLSRKQFSFRIFYRRRVKRIFPALIVVLAASFAFGWISLLPEEFMKLGQHMAASAGFMENFQVAGEAGYFDTLSSAKPLMHLWSLAIEEQFYLIWPVLIWELWRMSRPIALVVTAIGVMSFALNIVIISIEKDPTAAFFWPQTRIWELLTGAIMAYFQLAQTHRSPEWLSQVMTTLRRRLDQRLSAYRGLLVNVSALLGLLTVLAAVFYLHEGHRYPGWRAMLPVGGALLMLSAGANAWVNRRILGNWLMVQIGLISYPLYLWHWPLLSFLRIEQSDLPSAESRLIAVALSILLAWLTFRLVERPIRFGNGGWVIPASLCVLVAMLGMLGFAVYEAHGLTSRPVAKLNDRINSGLLAQKPDNLINQCGIPNDETAKKFPYCLSDRRSPAKFALLGDSKAAALARGVFMQSSDKGRWLLLGGNGPNSAPVFPVISNSIVFSHYEYLYTTAVDAIKENKDIEVVVIAAATRYLFGLKSDENIEELNSSKNYGLAFSGLYGAVSALVSANKKVVLTIDNPSFKDPRYCIDRVSSVTLVNRLLNLGHGQICSIELDRQLALSSKYRRLLDDIQARFPHDVRIYDTLDDLCDMVERVCSSFLDGRLLYSYADHISEYASSRIAMRLVPFVERFAESASNPQADIALSSRR